MSETTKPTQEEVARAVEDVLTQDNAEQRLYDLLARLPAKRVLCGSNGDTVLIEQHYTPGKVSIIRGVTDLRKQLA